MIGAVNSFVMTAGMNTNPNVIIQILTLMILVIAIQMQTPDCNICIYCHEPCEEETCQGCTIFDREFESYEYETGQQII